MRDPLLERIKGLKQVETIYCNPDFDAFMERLRHGKEFKKLLVSNSHPKEEGVM